MDGVVFYINVIIDYECAFDYRNMIIDLSGSSKKKKKNKQTKHKKKKKYIY
jgi:phage-related protein